MGSEVREFLKTCSKARNFRTPILTEGWKRRPPFVRADGAVHLNAKPAIDPYLALIVDPRNSENDGSFRLHDAFQDAGLLVFRARLQKRPEAAKNFFNGLVKFWLVRIALLQSGKKRVDGFSHSDGLGVPLWRS
jgi:hypothetical protein